MTKTESQYLPQEEIKPIFLIGFMGSGKTTLGRKLASVAGYRFFDMDELISKKVGTTIADFFSTHGEQAFREVEKNVLHQFTGIRNAIVATGGGVPCYSDNMEWMNKIGITVYLNMSTESLHSRLSQKQRQTRPLIKDKSSEQLLVYIKQKLTEREPFYQQAAFIIDAMDVHPKTILKKLKR